MTHELRLTDRQSRILQIVHDYTFRRDARSSTRAGLKLTDRTKTAPPVNGRENAVPDLLINAKLCHDVIGRWDKISLLLPICCVTEDLQELVIARHLVRATQPYKPEQDWRMSDGREIHVSWRPEKTHPAEAYDVDHEGNIVIELGGAAPRGPHYSLSQSYWQRIISQPDKQITRSAPARPKRKRRLRKAATGPRADQREANAPDANGYVETPADPSAYLPMTDIVTSHTPTDMPLDLKALRVIVEAYTINRVRWTRPKGKRDKPKKNRRSVHLSDWVEYRKRRAGADAEGFPRLSNGELEAQKKAIRETNQRGK